MEMEFYLYAIGIPILAGFMASLPVLLPPLLRMVRKSYTMTWLAVFVFGAVATLVTYGFGLIFCVENILIPLYMDNYNSDPQLAPYRADIGKEVWLENMIPAFLRPDCFSNQEIVCEFSGEQGSPFLPVWSPNPLHLYGLLSFIPGYFFIWLVRDEELLWKLFPFKQSNASNKL
jgi:hypothetical protein